jgi:hypothetical protein
VENNKFLQSKTPSVNLEGRTPYTFKQWYDSTSGIIPSQEYRLYTEYLIEWYKQYNLTAQDSKTIIKLKYLSLLNQLQLFFSTQELEDWYNKINIEDEKELLLAIPYFSRKLKEITYYYFQLRDKIKNSRIRHGLIGTEFGLTQQVRELLLENYNQSSITIPVSIWQKVPALSSLTTDIHVVVEDLYDTFSYFDHSSTLPASAYHDITNSSVQDFILSRNLNLSCTDWLYRLGTLVFSLSTNNPILQQLHQQLLNQTINNNFLTTETYNISTTVDFFNIDVVEGINSFYWPQGNYLGITNTFPRYQPIPLSSESLSLIGTPNDTLFVRSKQGIEGAWLYNKTTNIQNVEIQAKFNASTKTIFKFPFPGYGISAEDIPWTGYGFKTDIRYNYLDDDLKRAVEQEYWNTNISLTSVQSITLNETTLSLQGAYPSTNYVNADKIRIRKIPPGYNSISYTGDIEEAWLYRMNETSISIPASKNSTILWPFKKLNNPRIDPIPTLNYNEVCTPISLSSLKIDYSVAGDSLRTSDAIYKLKRPGDNTSRAVECAWLSGAPYFNGTLQLTGTQQSSLNCIFSAGAFTRFIWNGPYNSDVNKVFKSNKHYPNCEFLKIVNPTVEDFVKCTCKQVNFTPFGHPGKYFTDYNQQTDFIVEDNFTPQPFDLNEWRDNTGTSFAESTAFCWFKTDKNTGWETGKWNCSSNITDNNFYLQKGKGYVYYRAGGRKTDTPYPDYITRYKYNQYPGIWIKAKINPRNGQWVTTNQPSDMIIYPGDFLLYSRTSNLNYTLTGEVVEPILSGIRINSIWSNYDLISIPDNNNFRGKIPIDISVIFPNQNYIAQLSGGQYPPPGISTRIIQYVAWKLTTPNNEDIYFYDVPAFSFTPTLTGIYTTALTAITSTGPGAVVSDGYYYVNTIPAITATVLTTQQVRLTSAQTKVPGFTLRVPLNGWDYNTNSFNPAPVHKNFGAKPYWATFNSDSTSINNLAIADDYNLISVPDVSPIVFTGGEQIEYTRNYNTDLIWSQPLTLLNSVNERYWATLQINVSGLSNQDLFDVNNNSYFVKLSTPSIITLQNFIDNEPVEIIYNADSSFTWPVTAVPTIETLSINSSSPFTLYQATFPWRNVLNQTNPSLAVFPAIESLSSVNQIGGFYTPDYCGVTKYLNRDYTYTLDITSNALTGTFIDPEKAVNIRGLSKQDQTSPYNITDNNTWLKEPPISSNIAGIINKNIFKKYQKFIPYQSTYESNPNKAIGLILPTSQQAPWNGINNTQWGDQENKPTSYTGVINVSSWVASQVLKNNNLFIDNWCTDIHGNQYGLYKNYNDTTYIGQQNIPGEIWVRNNKQKVLPGYLALSSVFDTFIDTDIYTQLVGNTIYGIDVFYNTLYIQTSGILFIEKVNYDYNTQQIYSISDDARFISLMTPVTTNVIRELNGIYSTDIAIPGETWFDPSNNIALFSTVNLNGNILVPNLFEYNLINGTLRKVFPITQKDIFKLTRLNTLNLKQVFKPKLSYNKNIKQYVFTVLGITQSNENVVIEFKLNFLTYDIYSLTIYYPSYEILPPTINHSLLYTLTGGENFSIQLTSTPINATFNSLNLPNWANLNSSGILTGTVPIDATGSIFTTFTVNNNSGLTYQILTFNIL